MIITHPSAPQPVGTLFRSWLDEARVGSGDIVLQKYGVASLSQSGRFRGMGTDVCLGFIRFQLQRLRPAASTRRVKESVLLSPPGLWNLSINFVTLGGGEGWEFLAQLVSHPLKAAAKGATVSPGAWWEDLNLWVLRHSLTSFLRKH